MKMRETIRTTSRVDLAYILLYHRQSEFSIVSSIYTHIFFTSININVKTLFLTHNSKILRINYAHLGIFDLYSIYK